jgi:hypothetical protein
VAVEPAAQSAATPDPSLRSEWRFLSVLALWFVAVAMAVGVYRNVPVIDDWVYAWSVERLLIDGRLEVLDWSAVYPLVHTLWGAAWSLVFGFSFATLRLSTLAFALLGSCALYLILRELEASPRMALLGALSVAANPVVLLLSFSFMTDVPFVALTLMALLCYIRAMRRGELHLVWWGGAWACAGFLDRQIGMLTPVAALPLLLQPSQIGRMKRSSVVLAVAVTWATMFAASLAMISLVKPTGEMMKLVDRLSSLLQIPAASYVGYNLYILSTVAFFALPALLAMATVGRLWRTRTLALLLLGIAAIMLGFIREIPVPLRPGSTWTLIEVGGSRGLINGALPMRDATSIELVLRGLGLLATALAAMALVSRAGAAARTVSTGRAWRPLMRRAVDAVRTIPITTRTPLVVYLAGYLLLVNVLWMYNDRYVLVLVPIVAALALGWCGAGREVPRLAWLATAVFALVGVAGTRDALRFNESVRDSWQLLVDSGVRPADIDAGYAWTGWVLYAHPENLSKGLTVHDVPWVTSMRKLPYILSKTRLDGYNITREVAWTDDAPWPGPDRLLVLKRRTPN